MNEIDNVNTGDDVKNPLQITGLYTFIVPAKSGDEPGIYDSALNTNIPTHVSSFFIHSISGADTIDMQIFRDAAVVGDIPNLSALDSFGSELYNMDGGFTRFKLFNNATVTVTVEIRLNKRGTFRKIAAGGGGGVATHVSIDGVANIAGDVGLKDGAKVKVDGIVFPNTMAVSGDVGLKDGAKVKVDGIVFPNTMAVSGDVGLKDGAKVKVDGIVFPNTMAVSGDVGLKDGAKVKVTGVDFPDKMKIEGVVGLSSGSIINTVFMDDAEVAIKGTPSVKLDSGTIKVDPVPSPTNCAGARPIVNKAMAKIVSSRPKRVTVLIQADINNTSNLWLCDASDKHVLCGIVYPGSSAEFSFSGELWAQSANDGQKCYIAELYNL